MSEEYKRGLLRAVDLLNEIGDKIFADVCGRSGNTGVAKMRALPLWNAAKQLEQEANANG